MRSIILIFLAVCCLPFFGVGLYEAYKSNSEISGFVHTEGTVVGNSYVNRYEDGNVSGAYQPEVEFTLPTGEKKRFTDGIGSLPPDYETGEKVEVIYNPNDPRDAHINSWKRIWFAPVLFMAIGLVPFTIGAVILYRLRAFL